MATLVQWFEYAFRAARLGMRQPWSVASSRLVRESLMQAVTGYVHEPDFHLFRSLPPEDGLFVDIGAHRGQSALSFAAVNSRYRIFSIEANPAHEAALQLVRRHLGSRFRFRLCGLGERCEKAILVIPVTGNRDLSANATLRHSELTRPLVRKRLSKESGGSGDDHGVIERSVEVMSFDDLNLRPDAIKLDVEGSEATVIKGMLTTLRRHQPVLLIELNHGDEFLPILEEIGYRSYRYDAEHHRLHPYPQSWGILNIVCIHDSKLSTLNLDLGGTTAD